MPSSPRSTRPTPPTPDAVRKAREPYVAALVDMFGGDLTISMLEHPDFLGVFNVAAARDVHAPTDKITKAGLIATAIWSFCTGRHGHCFDPRTRNAALRVMRNLYPGAMEAVADAAKGTGS